MGHGSSAPEVEAEQQQTDVLQLNNFFLVSGLPSSPTH
jgi:hypothetical protein